MNRGTPDLFRLWFGLDVPVSRRAYAASGFGLMALKYGFEASAIYGVTGHFLSPLLTFSTGASAASK